MISVSVGGQLGLPGSDPCTRGPAHWCASLENILQCGVGVSWKSSHSLIQSNLPFIGFIIGI